METLVANFLIALKDLPTFFYIYNRWNVPNDPDDNKFVDCYVAANVQYPDAHFGALKGVTFPEVNVVKIQEFETILKRNLAS